ncbi:MAG TPA: pentapeptide repeat-containing protein [Reyranella sp.]|nr:pentapeptide repeat-containing protein [Reyranella sp.]
MTSPDNSGLEALLSALNRSAHRVQALWFSFLAASVYFALTAATTTHRDLLLEQGQILPLLNLKLPLVPFYVIGPALYVVLHAYFLIVLVLLARKARAFEAELASPAVRAPNRHRMLLENAIFLQIIVGAQRERQGTNGLLLRTIALISVAVVPILVLLLFQIVFLPYHSSAITWWHRGLVLVDLVLIWLLWTSYRREGGERLIPRLRPLHSTALRTVFSATVIWISIWAAALPNEWQQDTANTYEHGELHQMANAYVRNTLRLDGQDLIDVAALSRLGGKDADGEDTRLSYALNLSGRDLRFAFLQNADLRGVDLSKADLEGAVLSFAWLQRSTLSRAHLTGTILVSAHLGNSILNGAHLMHVSLQGANLEGAKLQGTEIADSTLTGANLGKSDLTGAYLFKSQLQAASMNEATFNRTRLREVDLECADLVSARLLSVDISNSKLDGVNFRNARLMQTTIRESSLWRAHGRPVELKDMTWRNAKFNFQPAGPPRPQGTPWDIPLAQSSSRLVLRSQIVNPKSPDPADLLAAFLEGQGVQLLLDKAN